MENFLNCKIREFNSIFAVTFFIVFENNYDEATEKPIIFFCNAQTQAKSKTVAQTNKTQLINTNRNIIIEFNFKTLCIKKNFESY